MARLAGWLKRLTERLTVQQIAAVLIHQVKQLTSLSERLAASAASSRQGHRLQALT